MQKQIIIILTIFSNTYCNTITHFTPLNEKQTQRQLLKTGNYLLPFLDVKRDDALFPVLQRIGATGILQGRGRHHDWSNETWLDIDSVVQTDDVVRLLSFYSCPLPTLWPTEPDAKTVQKLFDGIMKARRMPARQHLATTMRQCLKPYGVPYPEGGVSRKVFAIWVDTLFNPFERKVDLNGNFVK